MICRNTSQKQQNHRNIIAIGNIQKCSIENQCYKINYKTNVKSTV